MAIASLWRARARAVLARAAIGRPRPAGPARRPAPAPAARRPAGGGRRLHPPRLSSCSQLDLDSDWHLHGQAHA